MRKAVVRFIKPVVIIALIICCALFVLKRYQRQSTQHSDSAYLMLLREAYAAVTRNHVEKPDSKKLVQSMVDGMLATLDPHSAYLPPEPFKEMTVQMSGSFGGVGIELGTKEGRLTVIAPIDDTPALRAGIQANDIIDKIDGTSTLGMNISAAVKRMRGEKGTAVSLTILRADSPKPLVFDLIRDIIKIKSVKSRMLQPGYGYIRIGQFQERTGSEFKQALRELRESFGNQLKGLVIDLRFNPGGLVGSSVEVVNCFIGDDIKKTLIVSTKGRVIDANKSINATLGDKEAHYPIVVLINGGSASASEIVAGALQDHNRAIIMGKQSFGKGSVQSIIPLRGNAALKLTTARYYTPSGRSIQAKGIVPDIYVDSIKPLPTKESTEKGFKENDLDNRLEAGEKKDSPAKEIVPAEKSVSLPAKQKEAQSPHAAIGNVDLEKDYQLKRALELLQSLSLVKEQGMNFH